MPRKSKRKGLSCGQKKKGDKNAKRAKASASGAKLPGVKKVKQAVALPSLRSVSVPRLKRGEVGGQ